MRIALTSFLTIAAASPVFGETVVIEADRDATLIEHPEGELANGSGPSFFIGRTGQGENGRRRGLLYFDVAAVLPRQALVERVTLTLYHQGGNDAPVEIRVHRVMADWGEGPSSAGGGGGASAEPGDSTWIHTFYDHDFWVREGGQFVRRASASELVGPSGFYDWSTTNHLVQDVRLWLSAPHRNYGWVLIGGEAARRTAKKMSSREASESERVPVLEITYRLPARR